MPRRCTCCDSPNREAIDAALVAGELPGRQIAGRFGVTETSLRRHASAHLPAAMVKAQDAEEAAAAGTLLEQVQELKAKALAILDKAETAKDWRAAVGAIREARACVELLAKLAGELQEAPVVNIHISAEWVEVRALLLSALAPFPEARLAVSEALRAIPGE